MVDDSVPSDSHSAHHSQSHNRINLGSRKRSNDCLNKTWLSFHPISGFAWSGLVHLWKHPRLAANDYAAVLVVYSRRSILLVCNLSYLLWLHVCIVLSVHLRFLPRHLLRIRETAILRLTKDQHSIGDRIFVQQTNATILQWKLFLLWNTLQEMWTQFAKPKYFCESRWTCVSCWVFLGDLDGLVWFQVAYCQYNF